MTLIKKYFSLWKEAFQSDKKHTIPDLLLFMLGTAVIYLLILCVEFIFPEADVILSVASSAFTLIAMVPFISMIIKVLKS